MLHTNADPHDSAGEQAQQLPLTGLRVVEIGGPLGQTCGRALADLGAEVVKVEPIGGAAERRVGPFRREGPARDRSLYYLYNNTGKIEVELDLAVPGDGERLRGMLATADVLVDCLPPGELARLGFPIPSLAAANPGLIVCSLSGFGQTGPYRDYKCPDPVLWALGGQLWLCGWPDREPSLPPVEFAVSMGSLLAAVLVLVSLRARKRDGLPEHIDLSVYEAQGAPMFQLTNFAREGQIQVRRGSRHPSFAFVPLGAFPTSDGRHVFLFVHDSAQRWQSFMSWIGSPESLIGAEWESRYFRAEHADLVHAETEKFTRRHPLRWLADEGESRGIGVTPIATPAEFLEDPQTTARTYLETVEHPVLGETRFPRPPFVSSSPLARLRPMGTTGERRAIDGGDQRWAGARLADAGRANGASPTPPLNGLRVLDFSHAAQGPVATQWLAQCGAEVLKVESSEQTVSRRPSAGMAPELWKRLQSTFAEWNLGKHSVRINMRTPEGHQFVRGLVPKVDVIVGNFRPGVFEEWGLDFDTLRTVNPRIIVVNASGFGGHGPGSARISIAGTALAATGIYDLWRYPDDDRPVAPPIWAADYIGAGYLAIAILAALEQRDRTGQGQSIDMSQAEVNATLLGPTYLDLIVNGADPDRQRRAAYDQFPWEPNAVFRCAPRDQWCVITVTSDDEWASLCRAIGFEELGQAEDFRDFERRRSHRTEIHELVESWTSQRSAYQVMHLLQKAGVPAGVVQSAEDLYRCPQLRERNFVSVVEAPGVGEFEVPGLRFRFENRPVSLGAFPEYGGATAYVATELLGMTDDEYAELVEKKVLV